MTDPINPEQGSSNDASATREPEVDVDTIQDLDSKDDDADQIRGGACPHSRPV